MSVSAVDVQPDLSSTLGVLALFCKDDFGTLIESWAVTWLPIPARMP
jgi:hypothetical protein